MPGGDEPENNGEGRIRIREVYNLILAQNDARHEMERRITEKLDEVAGCVQAMENQVATNTKEIDKLRSRDWVGGIIASAVGAAIGIFGGRQ